MKEDVDFYEHGSEVYYLLLEPAFLIMLHILKSIMSEIIRLTNLRKGGLCSYIVNSKKIKNKKIKF